MLPMPVTPSVEVDRIIANLRQAKAEGKPTALGACIFAGGFSIGVEMAGFKVAGHLELPDLDLGSDVSRQRWPVAVAPLDDDYAKSVASGRYWPQDRSTLRSIISRLKSEGLQPDFLYTNPPCSAFAKQGDRKGLDDQVMRFTRYCAYDIGLPLAPKVWAWELVPGVFDDARQFLDEMAGVAFRHGYKSYAFLTSAALHGGYQNRERFHFVASKVEIDFQASYDAEPDERKGWRTLGDALKIVENAASEAEAAGRVLPNHSAEASELPGGSLLDIIPFCPPGLYLREVHDGAMAAHYRPYGREWNGESRAGVTQARGRRDRTCPVIVGGHTVVHPDLDRFLTVRESATVMGFPLDYEFSAGSRGYQEVGKGLCSHNSRFLAQAIKDGLATNIPASPSNGLTVVDWRSRANTPPLSSTPAERRLWWIAKYGDPPSKPIEWADGRAKGKPGRPVGSRNKPSAGSTEPAVATPKRILYVASDETIRSSMAEHGIEVVQRPGDDESTTAWLDAAASTDGMIIGLFDLEDTTVAMSIGVAVYRNKPVVVLGSEGSNMVEIDGVKLVTGGIHDVLAALGIDVAQAAREELSKMSTEELLKLLAAARAGQAQGTAK